MEKSKQETDSNTETDLVKRVSETYLLSGLVNYVMGTCGCNYCNMIKAMKKNNANIK